MTAPTQPASPAASAQAAQAGLVIAMATDLERSWAALDVSRLRATLPNFTQMIAAIVRRYGLASGALAARFYKAQATAAVAGRAFTVRPADVASLPQIGRSVDWATQPLWAAEPDLRTAQTNVTGVAEKLVLDVGRQTVIDNVQRDPRATGWARIPEASPCAFCAMLATRGAVYKHQTANFRSHDHCRCHAEPVFGDYQASPEIERWRELYRSIPHGKPAAMRRDFRRAFEQ